jgi:hypothetical protein
MTGSRKLLSFSLVLLALTVPLATLGASAFSAAPAAAASTATPSCTFNGSTFPIVGGVTPGSKIDLVCTGLPALTPFLLFETSLVLAIDPQTAALLAGTVSPSLLVSVLSALPMINPQSFSFPTSDENGDLNYTYTTPTSQASDPNAVCPPTREEFNSGLIGCALAMVDLTTANEEAAGSAVLQYKGFSLFPPSPSLQLSKSSAAPGTTIYVGDKKNATTYWWLATLAALEGGTSTHGVYISKVGYIKNAVKMTPASYNGSVFTPPKLSGSFVLPTTAKAGSHNVIVDQNANLSGFGLSISNLRTLNVT